MAINDGLLEDAIDLITALDDVAMSYEALVEDVVLMAKVWPDENDFRAAIASTRRAMEQVCGGRVAADPLARAYDGWYSYHYQLRRQQGAKADLRLVFRPNEDGIEVKGFGHRYRPMDLYHRILHESARPRA